MGGPAEPWRGVAGRLLAAGRDAEIFEAGAGLVLRRTRDGRSLAGEAAVMSALHERGFPVPAVEGLTEEGDGVVMERVDGPSMLADLETHPWRVRRHARTLASLHERLHALEAPAELPPAPGSPGDRVLHLDLHPLNVIMSGRGPVVIDWTNAHRGAPAVDVALTWLLIGGAAIPTGGLRAKPARWLRADFVRSFIGCFDAAEVGAELRAVVEWKRHDPNMATEEVAAMDRIAAEHSP